MKKILVKVSECLENGGSLKAGCAIMGRDGFVYGFFTHIDDNKSVHINDGGTYGFSQDDVYVEIDCVPIYNDDQYMPEFFLSVCSFLENGGVLENGREIYFMYTWKPDGHFVAFANDKQSELQIDYNGTILNDIDAKVKLKCAPIYK